jgi:hypothetical protein
MSETESTPSAGTIYVATDSFVTVVDGERIVAKKGKTRVREGHPLHRAAPSLFKPLDVQYDVETARAEPVIPAPAPAPAPAAPAPAKKAAAKKAAAPKPGKE